MDTAIIVGGGVIAAILTGLLGALAGILITNEKSRRKDFTEFKTEINENIAELKTETNKNIAELKTEINENIAELKTEINKNIAELKTEIKRNNTEHQEAINGLRAEFRQELREEVGGLREEMNAGFARVNRRIDDLILVVNPPESLAPVELPEAKTASG